MSKFYETFWSNFIGALHKLKEPDILPSIFKKVLDYANCPEDF